MIEAVIFDMDGVIIDSEPLWREAEVQVFNKHGLPLTPNDCRKTTGLKITEVVEYWQNKYPDVKLDVERLSNEILEEVSKLVLKHGEPMMGVVKSIGFLNKIGVKLALASGSNYSLINAVLKKLKLQGVFSVIQSAEDLKYGKPHPEIFLLTAQKLDVKPSDCLVIEDSVFGLIAAKAANMKCIAIPDSENQNAPSYAIADAKLKTLHDFTEKMYQKLNI
ncbi:MAG: hexitol phosphatase HxpB [Salinivirgaceae bacterium]|nr:hexitol phosphatase HxpB [Salinivirgaceae bacterium]